MLSRSHLLSRIRTALKRSRVVVLVGPRQSGKTTLARQLVPASSPNYFDLEDPSSLALFDRPKDVLNPLRGLVVIDEVQRSPELFPLLRVLADRRPLPARFLILGSASPALLKQSSESLAGRVETISIAGFDIREVGLKHTTRHWLRGGFPLSYLARSIQESFQWRKDFIRTFLERDVPHFGFDVPAPTLLRFWMMLTHCHGQIWNAADPARSLGLSEPSVRRYLDLMTNLFMVRQLQPWYVNIKKRQVKAPKVYIRDSGLLHALLNLSTESELAVHPKYGASWEGYVIEEIHKIVEPDESYFWATHGGAELDLLMIKRGKKIGVECKRSDAPRVTPSMESALHDLRLDKLFVVYPGKRSYQLSPKISVVPFDVIIRTKGATLPNGVSD